MDLLLFLNQLASTFSRVPPDFNRIENTIELGKNIYKRLTENNNYKFFIVVKKIDIIK